MISRFEMHSVDEFMVTLKDFTDSLEMWHKENSNNTWDLEVEIGKGIYVINVLINESKDKSEQYI